MSQHQKKKFNPNTGSKSRKALRPPQSMMSVEEYNEKTTTLLPTLKEQLRLANRARIEATDLYEDETRGHYHDGWEETDYAKELRAKLRESIRTVDRIGKAVEKIEFDLGTFELYKDWKM